MKSGKHSESLSALSQALWFWRHFDAIELYRIKNRGNRLDDTSIRRIAKTYKVARTLSDDDSKAAACINELADQFAGKTLTQRAELCLMTADILKWKKTPKSAVSKLVWFVAPAGWTMFDSFACAGVGLSYAHESNFSRYYQALEDAGHAEALAIARKVLEAHGFPVLLAERFYDWAIMTRGERDNPSDGEEWLDAYLNSMREDERSALIDAAKTLEEPLDNFRPKASRRRTVHA